MLNWLRGILVAGLLSLSPGHAGAEGLGLEFSKMKIGTTAHYIDNRGRRFQYTYSGKFGSSYNLRATGSRQFMRTYNAQGYLTKLRDSNFSVGYRPYFCDRKLGDCRFFYDFSYSKYHGTWNGRLEKKGDAYVFRIYSKNKSWGGDIGYISMKFGKYNFLTEYVAGSNWFRLEKITTP
jgi:hypothetical protein